MEKKALIALSGGVDSAVAAALTRDAGFSCVGVTMRLLPDAPEPAAARQVAAQVGIPFAEADFCTEFRREVIDRFIAAYERGETPNPCIECNRRLKFSRLFDEARRLGCDTVVTGHYARVGFDPDKGRYVLKKAKNLRKDQSYVLYTLTQEQLAHTRFPLGDFADKEEVRQAAEALGFTNARQHDSQDICFIPDGDYAAFIRRETGKTYPAGDFVTPDGKVLGRHKGIIDYTVGQRRGLGLSLPAPLYVCRKCPGENTVVLTPEADLYRRTLTAREVNWIAGEAPDAPIRLWARTRYSAKEAPATVTPLPDARVRVVFDEPQRAITEGQSVVFYDGDEVIGGGTIDGVE